MTISSEISKLQTNLSNAYSAAEAKGATLPASQNFDNLSTTINSINVETITVDQTYDATSTNAQSGTAVAEAVSSKQDTLVSGNNIKTINGNSLLGSGNIAIETNTDDETISYNSSDALQVIAVKNVRDNSTLPIWQGTESQWEHDVTVWYNWRTNLTVNIEFLTDSLIPITQPMDGGLIKYEMIFTNGVFLTAAGDYGESYKRYNRASYSIDNGRTWQSSVFSKTYTRSSEYGDKIAAGDGKVIYSLVSSSLFILSTDNGLNFSDYPAEKRLTFYLRGCLKYCNDRFIAIDNTTNIAYDSSGEWNWQYSTMPISTTWNDVAYGNGIYVAVGNGAIAYSTDNCATWHSATPPRTANWESIVFGDGKFVVASESGKGTYSINGTTWLDTTEDLNGIIKYGDNHFVVASSTTIKYSSDLNNWFNVSIPNSDYYPIIGMEYGNGHFIIMARLKSSEYKRCFDLTFSSDSCYTIEELPTTTSTVYSAPETTSALTVSSVTSGAITLSNNNTYYYNQSGNVQTYDTIGNSHPEYLCFIDGVGVKIGNTVIATNNSNS